MLKTLIIGIIIIAAFILTIMVIQDAEENRDVAPRVEAPRIP